MGRFPLSPDILFSVGKVTNRGFTKPWTEYDRFRTDCAMEFAEELDATGLLCPLPVLKARKRLQGLSAGAILRVRADDPAAVVDIPHFCTEQGHDLIEQQDLGAGSRLYVIRKGG